MTSFEDVISKAKSVAEVAGKKTSDFIEVTRLKIEAAELEKEMSSVLEGLGRLVYDARKAGEDVSPMVDDCVTRLNEYQLKIDALRKKIDAYRYTVRCKDCGAPNPDDAAFCKKCGAKVDL
ncbi:MAG: zinc ribbon domain-containing protein [Clostridiales bacterium]|nr:zinc ribbon domain-containing protein [Clostridiales bacterium]